MGNNMISNKEILKQRARNEIYTFILEHPGVHLREIERALFDKAVEL